MAMTNVIGTERMKAAWSVVCPAEHAKRLQKQGHISAAAAAFATWKDRICAVVRDAELEAAGVTIEDVVRAVEFYTATKATVTRERIAADMLNPASGGYLVIAAGYRMGPAGP